MTSHPRPAPVPAVRTPDPRSNAVMLAHNNKDQHSRLRRYVAWLDATGRRWAMPELAAYRDHLLSEQLAPSTVQAHLATVRTRYQMMLLNRQIFFDLMPESTFERQKALADELIARIENAIDPRLARVRVVTDQDPAFIRLTREQAGALIRSIKQPRDKVIVALLLATGIRAAELAALEVDHLRAHMDDGTLALSVVDGKGGKSRKVPYGGNEAVLRLVDDWLDGRRDGYVFPGSGASGHITTRTIERIFERHAALVNGEYIHLEPHDCRRSYARMQYVAGMDIAGIQQNMGHSEIKTTLLYIGELDAGWRIPQAVLEFE